MRYLGISFSHRYKVTMDVLIQGLLQTYSIKQIFVIQVYLLRRSISRHLVQMTLSSAPEYRPSKENKALIVVDEIKSPISSYQTKTFCDYIVKFVIILLQCNYFHHAEGHRIIF